jgi:hypothetical protein
MAPCLSYHFFLTVCRILWDFSWSWREFVLHYKLLEGTGGLRLSPSNIGFLGLK